MKAHDLLKKAEDFILTAPELGGIVKEYQEACAAEADGEEMATFAIIQSIVCEIEEGEDGCPDSATYPAVQFVLSSLLVGDYAGYSAHVDEQMAEVN